LTSFLAKCGPSSLEVNGDVFIVTESGASIKLGLVEVRVIAGPELKSFLDLKQRAAKVDIETLKPGLLTRQNELISLKNEVDKLKGEMELVYPAQERQVAKWRDALQRLESRKEEYYAYRTAYFRYSKGPYWTQGLPLPVQATKTDADGKFSFNLKPGRYALIATSTLKAVDNKEEYFWLIWIDVGRKYPKRIFLNNDNLLESKSADCVVPFDQLPY
jgi:hypothetical protein